MEKILSYLKVFFMICFSVLFVSLCLSYAMSKVKCLRKIGLSAYFSLGHLVAMLTEFSVSVLFSYKFILYVLLGSSIIEYESKNGLTQTVTILVISIMCFLLSQFLSYLICYKKVKPKETEIDSKEYSYYNNLYKKDFDKPYYDRLEGYFNYLVSYNIENNVKSFTVEIPVKEACSFYAFCKNYNYETLSFSTKIIIDNKYIIKDYNSLEASERCRLKNFIIFGEKFNYMNFLNFRLFINPFLCLSSLKKLGEKYKVYKVEVIIVCKKS